MAEYTHETLAEKLATELMWLEKCGSYRGNTVWKRADGDFIWIWHPTRPEGVAQALECLHKWCGQNIQDLDEVVHIYDGEIHTVMIFLLEADRNGDNYPKSVGELWHKHLSTAICLALASAIDSEQATIKEV